MKKDLNKIKEEMQSAVIGAKNRYVKQLENSKICECGNKKLSQSKTCHKCYNKKRPLFEKRKTQEFRDVFKNFLKKNQNVYTVRELAEIFDMSIPSIYGYVKRLKVSKFVKLNGKVKRQKDKDGYRTYQSYLQRYPISNRFPQTPQWNKRRVSKV